MSRLRTVLSPMGVGVFCAMLLYVTTAFGAGAFDDAERASEERALARLAKVQADPKNSLAAFTTDGCSAGLSAAWTSLGEVFPEFANKFGSAPPWEQCCVEHDRAYWQGEAEQGYQKRLKADETFRRCVIEYGQQHRAELIAQFEIPAAQLDPAMVVTAELMYHAVRIAGGPCSEFPWRWGYGWPKCARRVFIDPDAEF